jgi:hypothetical protein
MVFDFPEIYNKTITREKGKRYEKWSHSGIV